MRRTVRFRITALAAIIVTIVLVATAVALVVAQKRLLTSGVDENLETRADDLAGQLATPAFGQAVLSYRDEDDAVQLVSGAGAVIASNPTIGERAPLAGPPGGRQEIRTVDLGGAAGESRVLSRRVTVDGAPATLHVATSLGDVREAVTLLTVSLAIGVPVVVAVLAVIVWWLIGRTLEPVEAIRAEVASIGGADLHRRVPDPGSGDEISRLAETMNTMLDRLEESSERQQRFVADASHELRSPLTRMRGELEVDLAHPATADLTATHGHVLAETVALQHLVEDLLQLARIDAAIASPAREAVDLDDVVLAEARRLRDSGRVDVDTSGVAPAQVRGDADQLRRVVRNLAENAQRHAAATVRLTVAERDGCAEITVADDGPGVPAAHRERIFERFARVDGARTAGQGGSGLGLAIVRSLVQQHGGTVSIADGEGATFVVRLPLEEG